MGTIKKVYVAIQYYTNMNLVFMYNSTLFNWIIACCYIKIFDIKTSKTGFIFYLLEEYIKNLLNINQRVKLFWTLNLLSFYINMYIYFTFKAKNYTVCSACVWRSKNEIIISFWVFSDFVLFGSCKHSDCTFWWAAMLSTR